MTFDFQSTGHRLGYDPFEGMAAEDLLHWADAVFPEGLIMSTSFGIQSSVTLHLATQIRPSIQVIWVDTGYLPPETYRYAESLTSLLNLNLVTVRSEVTPAQMESDHGRLWESDKIEDLNRYDAIRKVEPMQRVLGELNATAWISGLRSDQTEYRQLLPRVSLDGGFYRIYPILGWSSRQVASYMHRNGLPDHPLFEHGYTTIGDAHSSRPMEAADLHERSTRFGGRKQECGLHLPTQASAIDTDRVVAIS